MSYSRRLSALRWVLRSLLALWLACGADAALATTGTDAYGLFYYRQTAIFFGGCYGSTVTSTFNGTPIAANCPDAAGVAAYCSSKTNDTYTYNAIPGATFTVGSTTTFIEPMTFTGIHCDVTPGTYTNHQPLPYTCPLNAPLLSGSPPTVHCICEGEVIEGKCRPPVDPCANAEPVAYGVSVPLYTMGGNGVYVYSDPNALATAAGLNPPSVHCAMDADQPDDPTKGCGYSQSGWEASIIDATWKLKYSSTSALCSGDVPGQDQPAPTDSAPPDSEACTLGTANCLPAIPPDLVGDDGSDPLLDADGDGILNGADFDDDNDGIPDQMDPTHPHYDPAATDSDSDGIVDSDDGDDDNDTIPDVSDPDHPDYTGGTSGGGTGGGTGTCDPLTETCGGGGTCDPLTETCGGGGTCDPATQDCSIYGGGGFYSPAYPDGIVGVYQARTAELTNHPILQSVSSTFTVNFSGSCPTWPINVPYLGYSGMVDFQCDPSLDYLWSLLSALVLASASILAIRTALE